MDLGLQAVAITDLLYGRRAGGPRGAELELSQRPRAARLLPPPGEVQRRRAAPLGSEVLLRHSASRRTPRIVYGNKTKIDPYLS